MLDTGRLSVRYVTAESEGDRSLIESLEADVVAVPRADLFDSLGDAESFDAVLVDDALAGGELLAELVSRVPERPCVVAGADTDPDGLERTLQTAVREGWCGYPVPADERARLERLERYDFEEPTLLAHLDGLTTTARECFDADVGFVGVVGEDEERFVTAQGTDWETFDRSDAICAHGLPGDGGAFVLSDLADDERVSPEVLQEGAFDFYAGVPLEDADGHRVGMLCVMDAEAREFDEADEDALRWLAEQAMVHAERYGRT